MLRTEIELRTVVQLKEMAKELGVVLTSKMRKADILDAICAVEKEELSMETTNYTSFKVEGLEAIEREIKNVVKGSYALGYNAVNCHAVEGVAANFYNTVDMTEEEMVEAIVRLAGVTRWATVESRLYNDIAELHYTVKAEEEKIEMPVSKEIELPVIPTTTKYVVDVIDKKPVVIVDGATHEAEAGQGFIDIMALVDSLEVEVKDVSAKYNKSREWFKEHIAVNKATKEYSIVGQKAATKTYQPKVKAKTGPVDYTNNTIDKSKISANSILATCGDKPVDPFSGRAVSQKVIEFLSKETNQAQLPNCFKGIVLDYENQEAVRSGNKLVTKKDVHERRRRGLFQAQKQEEKVVEGTIKNVEQTTTKEKAPAKQQQRSTSMVNGQSSDCDITLI